MMLPFALLLGAMALAPLVRPDWWQRHYGKIAFGLGAVTLGYYLFILRDTPRVGHTAHDYVSFIVLIGSLFVVASGIHLRVPGRATPAANVLFLFVGAVTANVLGTTGAAMLLIRPWLEINRWRAAAHHVVFFIFLVANVGGCLTPIGDPPLFLGYLQGVPFWWVAQHCWPMWATGVGILLAIFYVVDRINFHRASPPIPPDVAQSHAWKFGGWPNLFFLAIIAASVFLTRPIFLREALMLAAAAGSYFMTPKTVHAANDFNFHPVQEVAILFAGVFATMMPALDWLRLNAHALLGGHPAPGIFYWGTGILSTLLDNAPTYLGFFSAWSGASGQPAAADLLRQPSPILAAISVGAVFFGAATYIGNGPNFMVKAMADRQGAPAPSFPGMVCRFTLPFLLPVLVAVWLLFFRY